jgi:hypothetical protein
LKVIAMASSDSRPLSSKRAVVTPIKNPVVDAAVFGGPAAYRNWRAALEGKPGDVNCEFQLYSDARFTGEIRSALGPCHLLNLVPTRFDQRARAALVLRVYSHDDDSRMDGPHLVTNTRAYHGGSFADEIASIVSLRFGVRLKAGGANRLWDLGDRLGTPLASFGGSDPVLLPPERNAPVLPRASGEVALAEDDLLGTFPELSPDDASVLVKSARLYQDALWIADGEPEISWLFLVSAVEVVANRWRAGKAGPSDRLRENRPNLAAKLEQIGGAQLLDEIAAEIADSLGATKKFIDFLLEHCPKPLSTRSAKLWDAPRFREALRTVYKWRSRALHDGVPFPAPMCDAPGLIDGEFQEFPFGLAQSSKGGSWIAQDTPMLMHVFEYIVRESLLSWWRSTPKTKCLAPSQPGLPPS